MQQVQIEVDLRIADRLIQWGNAQHTMQTSGSLFSEIGAAQDREACCTWNEQGTVQE